jgi:hypothetical protein
MDYFIAPDKFSKNIILRKKNCIKQISEKIFKNAKKQASDFTNRAKLQIISVIFFSQPLFFFLTNDCYTTF